MTLQQKKLWQLVAEKAGSNLEARMIYDELIKKLKMSEETTVLSIIEREEGLEVRVSEKAYGNLAIIGLIEQIKFNLLNIEDAPQIVHTNQINKENKYNA